ncbi:lysostaphin resistance A-like protein [Brevibacillus laterosporus]|uniref:CPBP family intramembrane glutamic endopeptidase n=1 Tax=Brevibacillus laterosporus TaxID=1465 RepID=UPI002E1ED9FC|nr:lysostaphin resistance A-like protein [Brevibacillus laterosporus]MED1667192.1 lysostaphin resistance A-like protein [Brevibacillus laterosporus]MED1719740.1 lysostaphin resistance A-like protein [Brevibacillus laterosporus]
MLRFAFGAFIRLFLIAIGLLFYSFLGIHLGEYATPIYSIIATILLYLAFDKKNWSLGLNHRNQLNNWLYGIWLGFLSLFIVFIVVFVMDGHKIVDEQLDLRALFAWLMFCFIGAFGEELFVRGYLYGYIKHFWGVVVSVFVSSTFFALLHLTRSGFDIFSFFTLLLAGVLYALMREKTGVIWLSFGFHFAWNFFSGVLGIWRDRSVLFKIALSQQSLVNGGIYGIEGSIVSVLFFLILIALFYFRNVQDFKF